MERLWGKCAVVGECLTDGQQASGENRSASDPKDTAETPFQYRPLK